MFFNVASLSLLALAASPLVSSSPIQRRSYGVPAAVTPRSSIPITLGGSQIGSSQQGGNLDSFFGSGNFDASFNEVTIVKQQKEIVCSESDLTRVRQQLAVIQEFAKQVILQQICEVEVQTVVIQQVKAQFDNFGQNVRRSKGNNNPPSFDTVIAEKITQITQVISQGGNLGNLDLGFLGSDVGKNSAQVGGSNWSDSTSPGSVGNAYKISQGQEKSSKQAASSKASAALKTKAATSTASAAAKTETKAAAQTETKAAAKTTASSATKAAATSAAPAKTSAASVAKSTAAAVTSPAAKSSAAASSAATSSAAKSSAPARK